MNDFHAINSKPWTFIAGMLQFWMYIRKYHTTDPWVVKGLVCPVHDEFEIQGSCPKVIAVIICDTCQQALLCHAGMSYYILIRESSNFPRSI